MALDRLLNAAKRLVRLVNLDAPSTILQREVMRLADRARILDPKEWATIEAHKWRRANAYQHGLCAEDDCERPCVEVKPGALCVECKAIDDQDKQAVLEELEVDADTEALAKEIEAAVLETRPWDGTSITITITGPTASGKSYVANLIANLLLDENRRVSIKDSDIGSERVSPGEHPIDTFIVVRRTP